MVAPNFARHSPTYGRGWRLIVGWFFVERVGEIEFLGFGMFGPVVQLPSQRFDDSLLIVNDLADLFEVALQMRHQQFEGDKPFLEMGFIRHMQGRVRV